jgi:hypothetical protein
MLSGIAAGNTTQPIGPALDHQRARRELAQAPQRRDRVGAAAGDVDFLLGADHEVAQWITVCRCALTSPDCTYRCSPRPGLVSPHNTGR